MSQTIADVLRDVLLAFFSVAAIPMLLYFLVINTSYLALIVLASVNFTRHLRRTPFAGTDSVASSALTPGVSVVLPAYNEEMVILDSVRSVLDLRHPDHQVVVVNDGSTDGTLDLLKNAYDLVPDPRTVLQQIPARGLVRGLWVPSNPSIPLIVVDTENSGRSDSLNAGVNAATRELIVMLDADSLMDPDALLVVSQPFADDPVDTVATGGVIRAANGCQVIGGRVVDVRMPRQMVARIQVVEYLRSFLLGRTGWSQANALILISGAFGMFRRDVLVEVGGLDADCIGEDFELVMRIHRHMKDAGRDYRVVFVAEPVSWTEVPSTLAVLGRQRRRWHRGLWEVLWAYRGMTFNPKYGRVGMVALPYYWLFELFAPLIELVGLVVVPLGLALGVVNLNYALALLLVAYVYGFFVTCAALLVEEVSFHRYTYWRDLVRILGAAVAENIGYRQLTAVWRLQGWWAALRNKEAVWGTMTRTGFGTD
ncbi:glycosyltransferase family 2 protein [Sanguibacter antarcticus]|uniref:Cellulose synthase/poly-beta-1,6-N-acetylglucosamine synthase-like glycosyltransferase n=1 Tax=Sanguibacter antarcticus TaxID=372484 RepID=A0A2A9E4U4_9MICO|nr:glycosyltransferase [Sanguibacter antarcticus]PFG33656.1 cellulose synthase/poly-beta-1,6-N-acetylglucosamine synthase-like glycosyltransferase [Sanguibacter antarcticus]